MRPIKGVPSYLLLNATDLTFPGRFHKMELLDLHADTIMELPLVFDITHPSFYNLTSFVPPSDFFYIKVCKARNERSEQPPYCSKQKSLMCNSGLDFCKHSGGRFGRYLQFSILWGLSLFYSDKSSILHS